jgi:LytR cell envelope-related transcriptional attenuator
VDHPLNPLDDFVRPWRIAAFVAGAIALLELVVLLALGGGAVLEAVSERVEVAARESARATQAQTERTRPAPAKIPPAKVPRRKLAVVVLNGNGRTGAAATAASRVRREGYKIRSVGNASRADYPRSLVMYRPGFAGEGRRLARDLGVRQVGPLDGIRTRALRGAHAVFIVGA